MRIALRDGRTINLDRRENSEVVELVAGEQVQRWRRAGAIYEHCLGNIFSARTACLCALPMRSRG